MQKMTGQSLKTSIKTDIYELALDPAGSQLKIIMRGLEEVAVDSNMALLIAPEFADANIKYGTPHFVDNVSLPGDGALLVVRTDLRGDFSGWIENRIACLRDRIVCTARYLVDSAQSVAHWRVLNQGASLGLPSVHAFVGKGKRNPCGTTFPVENLQVSTASHNFQFWNACPRLLFTDGLATVAVGGTTLAHDYGLELKTLEDGEVEYLRFNYGGAEAPHPGQANRVQTGPRLQIQFTCGLTPLQVQAAFTQSMRDDGIVAAHRYRPEHLPWRRPWYCTWADQVLLGKTLTGDADWKGQRKSNYVLNQDLVMRAANRIREWNLNIGTIVIDAGWQDKRGDWNIDTDKFPDVRAMVDELHEMGFKVHFWWAALQVESGANILEREGFTYRLPHVEEYALDYTNPAVREYVGEKVDRWFSSGPGGWDIDGLKLDWLCERIHPVKDPVDPEWRGEERQLTKMLEMFQTIAARHKNAFAICGQARNPHSANLNFLAGLPENFSDDLSFLLKALPPLKAWMPDWWIKAHCVYQAERAADHIRLTRALDPNSIPELGIVLPENMPDEILADVKDALRA